MLYVFRFSIATLFLAMLSFGTVFAGENSGSFSASWSRNSNRSKRLRTRWFRRARAAWEAGRLSVAHRYYKQASRLPKETPKQQRLVLKRINYHRMQAMVMPVMPSLEIAAAAQAHADYLSFNSRPGALTLEGAHKERRGRRGFTGKTLMQRISRQGLTVKGCLEVVSAYSDPVKAVDHLMNTVYHRAGLLHPKARLAGFGAKSRGVVDLGWVAKSRVLAPYNFYPGFGQKNVSPRFAGGETPEPLPGAIYPVGPPISIGGASEPPVLVSVRLQGPKGSCPLRILRRGTAPRAELLGSFVFLIPIAPLEEDSSYEVDVVFALKGKKMQRKWTFKTGKEAAGEERWWIRLKRIDHPSPIKRGASVHLTAEFVASHKEAVVFEWKVNGSLVAKGRDPSFLWKVPLFGRHRVELMASYPKTPGAFARRGFEVFFGDVEQPSLRASRDDKRQGSGDLRFTPSPPWSRGDAVRIDVDPPHGQRVTRYDFSVDGQPLRKVSARQAWWRADGRIRHRFEVKMHFNGGTFKRTVIVKEQ